MGVDWSKRSMSAAGMSMKQITLAILTIQSSAHILVMHYSRTMPLVNGHRYFPSTAVFMNEVAKLTISLTMALYEIATNPKTPDTSTAAALFSELARAVFTGDSWKLAIPALLYTLQNSLQYIAISNLDAATFQVTNQLKILSTALFSVLLLGRFLDGRKWLSLLLLMLGVAIVHVPSGDSQSPASSLKDLRGGGPYLKARNIWDMKAMDNVAAGHLSKRSATYAGIEEDFAAANPEFHPSLGLTSLAVACLISGFSSVFFEKIIKESRNDHNNSVWVRNVQLSFYSLWPSLFIGVMFRDGEHIARTGFFTGYNWVVWTAILLQAAGGVLVAFVVKHADNIAKNFATSVSIILSFLASVFLFDFHITSFYIAGTAIVLCATYIYNVPAETAKLKVPQIRIPDEKEDEPSYFDLESVVAPARSPVRGGEAISTSRPGTPSVERIPHKLKSPDIRLAKRDQ